MAECKFRRGDLVVFCKTKHSTHPGPRAKDVAPARSGEEYTYSVDKYWVVVEARNDGRVVVQTRRGKTHVLPVDAPQLRRASWWTRFWHRHRFPQLNSAATPLNAQPE